MLFLRYTLVILMGASFALAPILSFAFPDSIKDPDQLKITIISTSQNERSVGAKNIRIKTTGLGIELLWESLTREKTSSDPWPSFKVSSVKGGLKSDNIQEADSYLLPLLWSKNAGAVERNSLLWFPQALIISIKNKKNVAFDAGIFFSDISLQQSNSENDVTLQSLRNLTGIGLSPPPANAPKKLIQELSQFLTQATTYKFLSQKNFTLSVDGTDESIPATVIGNSYIQITVLDIPSNALIVETVFLNDKIPDGVKPHWNYLKDWGGVKVSEISTK